MFDEDDVPSQAITSLCSPEKFQQACYYSSKYYRVIFTMFPEFVLFARKGVFTVFKNFCFHFGISVVFRELLRIIEIFSKFFAS